MLAPRTKTRFIATRSPHGGRFEGVPGEVVTLWSVGVAAFIDRPRFFFSGPAEGVNPTARLRCSLYSSLEVKPHGSLAGTNDWFPLLFNHFNSWRINRKAIYRAQWRAVGFIPSVVRPTTTGIILIPPPLVDRFVIIAYHLFGNPLQVLFPCRVDRFSRDPVTT